MICKDCKKAWVHTKIKKKINHNSVDTKETIIKCEEGNAYVIDIIECNRYEKNNLIKE